MKLWGAFIPLLFTVTAWCQQDSVDLITPAGDTLGAQILEINRIIILGNKVTRDRIITRELSLHPGDTIGSESLADVLIRDRSKIYNLRLFQTVVVRTIPADQNKVDIIIEVTERWYTFPQPLLELADRNFNVWWYNYGHDWKRVNYGMRLYRNNFRGLNEYIRVMAQFGYSRKFGLLYRVPNMGKTQKHGLAFNVDYAEPTNVQVFTVDHVGQFLETLKTQKKALGISASYSYRKSFYETHSLSVEYYNASISDTVRKLNPNYFTNDASRQMFTGISYSFNSEHRDVVAYPLKGYNFSGFISKIGLGLGDDVNLLQANAMLSLHYQLGESMYLSNFTSVFLSAPSEQPYSMYTALGYRRQIIRGFDATLIEGPNFAMNKTTLKKKIFYRAWSMEDSPIEQFRFFPVAVYLKVYYDFGYVQNYPYYENTAQNTRLTNRLLHGIGTGVDIVTLYDNVFRFEFSHGTANGTAFYFNLKKEF